MKAGKKRDALIVSLYETGYTLAEIGTTLEISKQRVYQIISCISSKSLGPAPALNPLVLLSIARRASSMIETVKLSRHGPVVVTRCLWELGVLTALQRLWAYRRRKRRLQRQKWGNRDVLAGRLRALAQALGHTPTIHEINKHSPPWHTDYYKVFGSIRAAQQVAGLPPNSVGRPRNQL